MESKRPPSACPSSRRECPSKSSHRITARLCIDHLRSARVRREEYVSEWLPEPLVTGAEGDPTCQAELADSLSMAFLRLLEALSLVMITHSIMETPRLNPIEQPQSLFARLAYWFCKRRYGRVLTPLKVIYARKPRLAILAQLIARTQEKHLTLNPEISFLVTVHVALLNGCSFCQDVNLARAAQQRLGLERFRALPDFRTSDLFSERERAALAYAEEATKNKQVRDETFEMLRAHLSETEIIELTWLNAAENYFNLQAAVLGIGSDELLEASLSPNQHAKP